jgi:hypothetical protein
LNFIITLIGYIALSRFPFIQYRFINEDTYEGEIDNPLSLNLYTYAHNNPANFIDPTGFDPVLIGYIYVIQGVDNGEAVTYVGSTAQDLLKRMGNHKWKKLITAEDTKVTAYDVKAELDITKSEKGTIRSARNEALRSAEQRVINKLKENGELLNERAAAIPDNLKIWKERHSVDIDLNSPKLALKGGVRAGVNSGFALLDVFMMIREEKVSRYEFAPYLLQDEGGVFTIGYARDGWFSNTEYWKTYKSDPKEDEKVYIDKDEFEFWKKEAQALWGRLDFWGDFVPGLFNPKLPVDDGIV